jgi:hypothetical protein
MFITVVLTTNYNEKRTMDTWSKRTQTKPICSELVEPILFGLKRYGFLVRTMVSVGPRPVRDFSG